MSATRHMSSDFPAQSGFDVPNGPLRASATDRGGLATGPHDPVSGTVREAPAEPLERAGTENADEARNTGGDGGIDGPRLTPQGRTGEDASGEDETDPMGGVKSGQVDKAEG